MAIVIGNNIGVSTKLLQVKISIGLDINTIFERKIVNIFLPISFNICFGCSKESSH